MDFVIRQIRLVYRRSIVYYGLVPNLSEITFHAFRVMRPWNNQRH